MQEKNSNSSLKICVGEYIFHLVLITFCNLLGVNIRAHIDVFLKVGMGIIPAAEDVNLLW